MSFKPPVGVLKTERSRGWPCSRTADSARRGEGLVCIGYRLYTQAPDGPLDPLGRCQGAPLLLLDNPPSAMLRSGQSGGLLA